jgi:hypothetical protein
MKITYVGASRGGTTLPDGTPVAYGATVDVPDELGTELLSRSYCGEPEWSTAKPKSADAAKES